MEFIRSLSQICSHHQGCVATIGNFDGVHRGHQLLIQMVAQRAEQLGLPSIVTLFEPQPQEFFVPDKAPARLTRLREKLQCLDLYHVDNVLCLRFNQTFANLTAHEFIEQVLVQKLAIKHLVIGDDFHFGRGRQGNFALLCEAGKHYGFQVESQETLLFGEERVSSTRIRQALAVGDMQTAYKLLGRPYTLCGRVAYGQQLGRTIGFPTLNIALKRAKTPLSGVFAVYVHGLAATPLAGIANVGIRPTLHGQHPLLEVHVFAFQQIVYGYYVEIEFVSKIREEQKFASLEALKYQIHRDAETAKTLLHSHHVVPTP